MQLSPHNIIAKITDSDNYFIVNLLSGNADILEPEVGMALIEGSVSDRQAFITNGYLVDPEQELSTFNEKLGEFRKRQAIDEIQIFFVPWYSCNFNCSYCYQSSYDNTMAPLSTAVTDTFFATITRQFSDRRFYTTLFGGEPLLGGAPYRTAVEYFLKKAAEYHIATAIVTNGYTLASYVPLLAMSLIREVQVTLDGPREIHDARRPLRGGTGSTFDPIVEGVDAALAAGLTINLRVVVDRENIDQLPHLAAFARERGWTANPLFKTQIGRNYELHHCSSDPQKLFTRIALYEKIYNLTKKHPEILDFHKPAYSVARFLKENGTLPDPLFDACPGCKTEWAYDYTGGIYSCTATVGKADERLGTFYPEFTLDDNTVSAWKKRDITAIDKCTTCDIRLACGGGCASVAKNRSGTLLSPDCRPVKELLGLGIAAYFAEELQVP